MSGELSDFAIPAALVVATSAAVHSVLAYACAPRRAVRSYLVAVAACWMVATVAYIRASGPPNGATSIFQNWDSILTCAAAMLAVAGVPAIALYFCVSGAAARRWIPVYSIGLSVAAIPVGFMAGLATACSFGNCL